jgi:DNA-binding transcriptional LysR family regulator
MVAKKQGVGREQPEQRWDDVRVFLAIYRERSLGRAGKRVGLDTSTMSRRLSSFEEVLGGRLFERTRQGLVPTRRGNQLVAASEAIEAAHARLLRDASSSEQNPEGTVRFSVAPGVADFFVAPALVRLRQRFPRIGIELDASTRALDLGRYEADLALRSVAPQGADLVTTKLLEAGWLAAGSKAFVAETARVTQWKDLPWIAWDRDLAGFAPSVWLERYAKGAFVALRTSHFGAQLSAAASGLGAVLVPEPYLRPCGLEPLRFAKNLTASAHKLPRDSLWLVGHRALRDVPRVAAVWDFFASELRS